MGKLGISENITFINEWLGKNEQDILQTKNYFVLKHIRIALAKLNPNVKMRFDEKYIKYLGDFIN